MVPSAWCQHFPLKLSQSRCVTYELGDQKQLPLLKKMGGNYKIIVTFSPEVVMVPSFSSLSS